MSEKLKDDPTETATARGTTGALPVETVCPDEERRYDYLLTLVHEFRNPLTALAGAVDILEDELRPYLDPKKREFFDIVEVSLARLNQMLDEMLELTALEGREIELNYDVVDVAALCRDALAEYEPRAKVFKVKLNPVQAEGELPKVECDPELITRVIANLVSNAVKYNKPGGEVDVSLSAREGNLRVAVADTGTGIPKADFAKVFTRFYRAPEVRQRKIAGTGLGLVIAKNIVELHGGEMSFTSRAGRGSTFRFTIPVKSVGKIGTESDGRGR
ncbi:MAG TPA: HAMP domain-containing sensor histidine kinase [bacterium]|nr:HAMP domain-containing sensor histidine kinase [bacterium]